MPQLAAFPGDHDVWRLPILGFDADRLIVMRDVDPRVPDAKRLLEDPGAATVIQVPVEGGYEEALQGVLELVDLKGKTPPALEPPVHVVPPGYSVLDLAKGAGGANGHPVPIDAPKAPLDAPAGLGAADAASAAKALPVG